MKMTYSNEYDPKRISENLINQFDLFSEQYNRTSIKSVKLKAYKLFERLTGLRLSWKLYFDVPCMKRQAYPKLLESLPSNPAEKQSLLDISCGNGNFLKFIHYFKNPHYELWGCEYISDIVNFSNKYWDHYSFKFFNYDVSAQKSLAESAGKDNWDYITILHSLEHFEDPKQVIYNCAKHCNKKLFIIVPGTGWKNHPTHLWYFDENTFKYWKPEVPVFGDEVLYIFDPKLVLEAEENNIGA
jgi:2-polyprenyl-3-methyl-5-hydroxy-6-metoxy-1,4-benzoquinol methylase